MSKRKESMRRGASMLEILVACTLLGTVLSVATPLVVRHNRLLTAHREYQMALDELSNQLERLGALPAAELPAAVEKLAPSELAAAHLSGAKLTGELAAADEGQRLTLHLVWDEPQRKSAPVSMASWIYRKADAAPQETSP
jgi:Tfp pilus assembly protein FimT